MSFHPRPTGILLFLAVTSLFLTAGCIRTSIPIPHPPATTPPSNTPGGTFSGTFADTAWTANYYTAYFYQSRGLYKFIGVANRANGDSAYVVIMFVGPFQLNQPIGTNTNADIYYTNWLGTFDWDAGNSSGNQLSYVNVTAYDPASRTIAGTFYGSLGDAMPNNTDPNKITIKNGAFNLTYTLQP